MASSERIFWYLREISHVGLTYDKSSDISEKIVGYVDSDYTRDLDKRRSQIRYVFTICGSVISWKEPLQFIVALSTTEVEYMSVIEAVKEVICLKGLVGDLNL